MASRRPSGFPAAARWERKLFTSRSKSACRSRFAVIAQAAQTGAICRRPLVKTSIKPPISVILPRCRSSAAGPKTGVKSSYRVITGENVLASCRMEAIAIDKDQCSAMEISIDIQELVGAKDHLGQSGERF